MRSGASTVSIAERTAPFSVLIAGGGTGGHLFPGIALAEELRRRDPATKILFVGTARGIEVRAVPKAGFELALLPVSGLRGKGVFGILLGVARLPLALWRALALVRRVRPSVAVSCGGYAAGPAVLAARLLGVACVVMEQNAVPGFTNKVLGRLASHVVAAMPVRGFVAKKVRLLGNPVRAHLLRVREQPYEPTTPLRVLVLGGSLGARALNETFMAAASALRNFALPLFIVHQTGEADYMRVQAAYDTAQLGRVAVQPFIDDMAEAYAQADLVVCRSGATTCAELTVCGRPSILVPFPFAVDDHQTANAKALAEAGAALWLPQAEATAARLLVLLGELGADRQRLRAMAKQARALGRPEAAAAIADLIAGEAAHV